MVEGIEKFKDLFKRKQYEKLSVEDKNKYIRQIITEILRENPRGLTARQIEDVLPFDNKTIRKHLGYLTAIREAYSIQIGNVYVYYPNGKLAHFADFENIEIGEKYYSFFHLINQYGNFVYIQEKERDRYNTFKTNGGLIVPQEKLQEFIERMISFETKILSRGELNENRRKI